jgi:anti-sigma factor ChrR (cupin superfamily)|tara:strand:+ start:12 stop:362 length:351 start_codon:yes stop_codon:yes gene_type:complete
MSKRKITDPFNVKFVPFDNYGIPIPGMSWHKITYNQKIGQGTYILKMEPGAKSKLHEHTNFEEFIILDGELTDLDNNVFKKGEIITYEPGSIHSSYTKNGCLILVFMRTLNKVINK